MKTNHFTGFACIDGFSAGFQNRRSQVVTTGAASLIGAKQGPEFPGDDEPHDTLK
jgi:hypothetical protein